jgi:hypothetical protein
LPVAEAGDAGHEHILPSFTSGQEAVDYARRRYREYAEAVSRRQG